MFKISMSGDIQSLTLASSFDDALTVLMAGFGNSCINGHIENVATGEVLVIIEEGSCTYIEEQCADKMLDELAETNPILVSVMRMLMPMVYGE